MPSQFNLQHLPCAKMSNYLIFICIFFMSFHTQQQESFKESQLKYSRVFEAYKDKGAAAMAKLKAVGVDPANCDVLIRGFKFEEDLEVWAKNTEDSVFSLVTTYKFCENIGELGPKRKEGDNQIPEGMYTLSKFNHASDFFLSLKVDYPNKSDLFFADTASPGGMIFIHGGCKTVGCIPITDEWIKELYVFCVEARNSGQVNIPIHIYPARLTDENYGLLKKQYKDESLHKFWGQLKLGYDLFEENKSLPRMSIGNAGEFFFSKK